MFFLLGMFGGFVGGVIVACLLRFNRCDHDWEVTGAQPMVRVYQQWGVVVDPDNGEPVTKVLEHCTICDDVRTRTLGGTWTIAQLKGGK